jgi:hypothetical protein
MKKNKKTKEKLPFKKTLSKKTSEEPRSPEKPLP